VPDPSPLDAALDARASLLDDAHAGAVRLFNGHLEGDPRYVVDAYGTTAVVFHHAEPGDPALVPLIDALRQRLPWLRAVVVKERAGATEEARIGRVAHLEPGAAVAREVVEHGVRYAVDLLLNQDAGFYLDTRHLRRWLIDRMVGQRVLNTFAYTGSLGVAALAGGAAEVLQTDLNARYLDVAKASTALNGFPVDRRAFVARDFFSFAKGAKLSGARFDTAIVDAPFFSSTRGGTIDLSRNVPQLLNKVRPLVRSGGRLVVVNNALYLSGADFMRELEALCVGGWLTVEATIDVPDDVTGFPETQRSRGVVDPAPFNHATKIVVLTVRHKT
jgi:23S rRNA (cytosine1962-C5)-methyltransferase